VTVPVTAPAGAPAVPAIVSAEDLRIGDVLAEGGEGRVHQLPRQPHLVLKSYRRAADRSYLDDLVAWPSSLGEDDRARVAAAAAWPVSVVRSGGAAVGLLMPRAPRRFSVRHRDGHSRLASLSYLTADPEHRAVAYGLTLPTAVGPERVGLVYALARLLAAFESVQPSVGHGDLSTKNVLWSLQRGPEVFVIDCDNCDLFGGSLLKASGEGHRRRAMTPNWDDPAVPRGRNPSDATDRYSLGLIFLRVVGAANFPIQARQRAGGRVDVRFPVPDGRGTAVLLDPQASVWDLCARSLSLTAERPPPAAWLAPLEGLLDAMGAASYATAVRDAQGTVDGPSPAIAQPAIAGGAGPDVVIVPHRAGRRERTWARVSPAARYGAAPSGAAPAATFGYRFVTIGSTRAGRPNPASAQAGATGGASPTWVRPSTLAPVSPSGGPLAAPPGGAPGSSSPNPWLSAGTTTPMWPELRAQLLRFWSWWRALHRAMFRAVSGRRRRPGRFRAVVFCLIVDSVILVLAGAAIALIVSPLIQH
jgi:hypothetical protein